MYQQVLFLGEVMNNFNNLLFTHVFSKFSLFCFTYILKEAHLIYSIIVKILISDIHHSDSKF